MAISISANPTILIEEAGTAVTITLTSSEPIPEGGLTVSIDSPTENALGQLDVFAAQFENGRFVRVNDDTSGFDFLLNASPASITVPIFDDAVDDAQDLTFNVLPGEGYTVDSSAASITLSLQDADGAEPEPPTENPEVPIEPEPPTENPEVPVEPEPPTENPEVPVEPVPPTENPEVPVEPVPPTGGLPVVSFETIPTTISEEAENNLVEWKWTVTGDFPEEGLLINFDTLGENDIISFTEQFAASPEAEFINSEIATYDEETGRLGILLSEPEASFKLYILNDIIEEGTQPFDFQLAPGEGYTVDPDKNSTLFTITDDNGGPGVGPTIGISASATDLAEGDELTINFNVDGEIPDSGVQVLVQSTVPGALGQFDLSDLSTLQLNGIEGLPEVGDAGGSSFFVTITEPTASITTSVFDDILAEEPLELPFTIVNGEEYEVDPDASSVTLNVVDESQPAGPTIGLTVDKTDVVEGDSITLTLNVDGEIPAEGVTVLVNDPNSAANQLRSLTEFDVAQIEYTGISEFPRPADGDSGFFVTITEPTATITVPVLDDGVDEDDASESFTFEVIDGEAYQVDSENSAVTLNISDAVATTPEPTPGYTPVLGSTEVDIIEVVGSNQLIFGGDSDDLIDASIGSEGSNRIYGGSGDDTVILGSADRIIGSAGDDKFFALSGGDNIITGGAGADQFWIATAEIPQAANIITDFTLGEDVLGIAGLGIGFDDLNITQQDDNTLIAANGSDLAILQGIGATGLSADNFAFA